MNLKFIIYVVFFLILQNQLSAQCAGPIVNAEFANDIAILGRDSVVFTAIESTAITLVGGGSNFHLYINNILQTSGNGNAQNRNIVKLVPHTVGSETILITGNTCGNFEEENTVIQCGEEAVNAAFPNDIAVIGQDEAVFTVSETTGITLASGGTNFHLYINNILISNGDGTAYSGDIVKIVPYTGGMEAIGITSTLCGIFSEENTVVANPLPITYLKSPNATIKNSQSHISWSVASQVNNSHFIIEHDTDGTSYKDVGKVDGHGNTSETKHYTYIHETPFLGINYYRIKQVDYDGQSEYSDMVSVQYLPDGREIAIYPNPATSEVTINTSHKTTLEITDIFGRTERKLTISEGQNSVNLTDLPSGLLIFVVGDQRYRVLKE